MLNLITELRGTYSTTTHCKPQTDTVHHMYWSWCNTICNKCSVIHSYTRCKHPDLRGHTFLCVITELHRKVSQPVIANKCSHNSSRRKGGRYHDNGYRVLMIIIQWTVTCYCDFILIKSYLNVDFGSSEKRAKNTTKKHKYTVPVKLHSDGWNHTVNCKLYW